MPEGDTVLRTARRLQEALGGRPLLAADLRWPGISTADLRGMVVTEVAARGKHILLRLDSGWTLHSHLRMDGQWRIERTTGSTPALPPREADTSARLNTLAHPPIHSPTDSGAGSAPSLTADQHLDTHTSPPIGGQRPTVRGGTPFEAQRHAVRAVLVGPQWTAIGLRLGMLDLVRTSEEQTLIGHLGPDILDADFDAERAVANLAASDQTIGAALLDQRNLAGIGTLWSSESLFLERLNPWRPAATLTPDDLSRLVARARRLMLANVDHAVQSSTGDRRHGRTSHVHARSGQPCRRCGGTVRVHSIGPPTRERPMFYCPRCQGGLAPGDDGPAPAPLGARRRMP